MSADPIAVLELEHLSKTFPGQRALDDVALRVLPGEVHGLVGQNGAGKSTLIKVLAGFHEPDAGARFALNGTPYIPAEHAGGGARIGFVHQDLALVPTLSAAENIALTRGFTVDRGGQIHWRREARRARELIAPFGIDLDVTVPVARLAPVQRAIVAMARAAQGALGETALLVLDEPTAALPAPEVERLLAAIRRFTGRGGGVLYVSHRLDELFVVADRVTVLRNGRTVATEPIAELDRPRIVSHMLGTEASAVDARGARPADDAPRLSVTGLTGARVRDLSFTVAAGEIVGVAGLIGSGREELAGLVAGAVMPAGGTIELDGEPVAPGSPRAALAAGLCLVPADRARDGLVLTHSVRENVLLPRLDEFTGRWGPRRAAAHDETMAWIERLGIEPPDPERPVSLLSGGNQQKVVLARALGMRPRALVLDEPGQGVDVGARARILELIAAAAADGIAVVFATSETEDLPAICHRVLVLGGGAIAAELTGADINQHAILAATVEDRPLVNR